MALKKTIAGYRHADGHWVDQVDVEMHPLEEAQIRAHWAIHDANMTVPIKPTPEQEHEWLVEFGADYVKQQRANWQSAYDTAKPTIDAAILAHDECTKMWNNHVEFCLANGFDKDTYNK